MEHIEANVGFHFHPAANATSENGMSECPTLPAAGYLPASTAGTQPCSGVSRALTPAH